MHLRWWSSPSSGMRPPQILYNWQGQWVEKGAFLLYRSIERERERETYIRACDTYMIYDILLYYIQKGSVFCAFYWKNRAVYWQSCQASSKKQKHGLTLRKRNKLYYESTYTAYIGYIQYRHVNCMHIYRQCWWMLAPSLLHSGHRTAFISCTRWSFSTVMS